MQDFFKKNRINTRWVLILIFSQLYVFSLFAQSKKDTVKVTIKGLGKPLNSAFADYAPVISADGATMLFTSRRPVSEKEIKKQKQSMEHIYITRYNNKTDKWQEPERLGETVNQPGRHNSAIALSNDGQRMLLYRDDENGNGDIYESRLEGDKWTEAVKLPDPVNSLKHESSASISPDGRTIYFVSKREGGRGSSDIWFSTQNSKGEWDKAKNISNVINTPEDEEGVYIHPDGKTLYFSSKGHKGLGGYDIFKSTYKAGQQGGRWTKPVNLGSPINTADDDVYFVITADGKTGYYASAKVGGEGEKDIYKIWPVAIKEDEGPKLTLFKGVVIDKITLSFLESEIEITDNQKNEIISNIKSNSVTGQFLISLPSGKNYGINVRKEGYLFYSDNVNIPDTTAYQEISKTIPLEKINIGSTIILKNIFFDYGKSTLREESFAELERLFKLMTEMPGLKVEISGHTDNKGSEELNQNLSENRAKAVLDYLISKGIEKERITYKGYGFRVPIASNDTEEGCQLNRRTEFKILSK